MKISSRNPIIIFDVDGVLLNSEKLYLEKNQQWFKELGVVFPIHEHMKFIGASATLFWNHIKATNKIDIDVQACIIKERELKYQALLTEELRPTPGLIAFIEKIRARNYVCAIASSGLRVNINLILNKLRMTTYFEFIVSGEDVQHGKPNPDIFLRVSKQYQQSPENCWVIEDSCNGVTAAKSAGMHCLGYKNPDSGSQDLSKADYIFDSFFDEQLLHRIEATRAR